jgi:uncharacterized protein
MTHDLAHTDNADIPALLRATRRIAVVGISDKPHRASHEVAAYLQRAGYTIVPVNPLLTEVLGQPCYPDLLSIPGGVDLVNVFRRPDEIEPVVTQALAIGANALWLQLGVVNEAEATRARQGGMHVVMDRCIKIDHAQTGLR